MKKLNRLYNRFYAFIHAYFWLPCPICGEMFGGHEVKYSDQFLMTGWHNGKAICYKESCAEEAKRRNETYMEKHKYGKKHFLHHLEEAGMNETTKATRLHIMVVREKLSIFIHELGLRSRLHDGSKLEEPEVSMFAEWSPKLSAMKYGSPEYHAALKEMGPALQHHYASNRHHPEHFDNGVMDMNLFDLLEMLADWKASTDRVKEGNIFDSLKINVQRFGIPHDLAVILWNTAYYLKWDER